MPPVTRNLPAVVKAAPSGARGPSGRRATPLFTAFAREEPGVLTLLHREAPRRQARALAPLHDYEAIDDAQTRLATLTGQLQNVPALWHDMGRATRHVSGRAAGGAAMGAAIGAAGGAFGGFGAFGAAGGAAIGAAIGAAASAQELHTNKIPQKKDIFMMMACGFSVSTGLVGLKLLGASLGTLGLAAAGMAIGSVVLLGPGWQLVRNARARSPHRADLREHRRLVHALTAAEQQLADPSFLRHFFAAHPMRLEPFVTYWLEPNVTEALDNARSAAHQFEVRINAGELPRDPQSGYRPLGPLRERFIRVESGLPALQQSVALYATQQAPHDVDLLEMNRGLAQLERGWDEGSSGTSHGGLAVLPVGAESTGGLQVLDGGPDSIEQLEAYLHQVEWLSHVPDELTQLANHLSKRNS